MIHYLDAIFGIISMLCKEQGTNKQQLDHNVYVEHSCSKVFF